MTNHFSRRRAMQLGAAGAVGFYSSVAARPAMAANDEVRLGFISCGGRARGLMQSFNKAPGAAIIGLCDPDEQRVASARENFPAAKTWTDLRGLLDDDQIDAVVVATCNHWHCLAAIWAMQAGKDVYVEKPLSHSQWEGRQTVAAANRYERICQLGTQQRSDPMQSEIKKFLHQDKALGAIMGVRVNRFGVRAPIGKRDSPLPPPPGVDMNLWLGPAQEKPIFRDRLHYDWHWDWNTGSGETGNWGVHVLDDVRNNVFEDKVKLPRKIFGGGGRVLWDDAGETPNLHFVYFETGSYPVVIGLANIVAAPGEKKSPQHPGPGSGYIVYCEGGRLEGQRGRAVAFDNDNNQIRQFRGNSGNGIHQQRFVEAVAARDTSGLTAPLDIGNDSTGWCNLANISFQAGKPFVWDEAKQVVQGETHWETLLQEMDGTLAAHGMKLDDQQIKLSPMLTIDPETETFVGENSQSANQLLKREYRKTFEVPEIA